MVDVRPVSERDDAEPCKAYLIRYAIANEVEAVVWADSREDALRRFQDGEGEPEVTGVDWRCRQPTVKRWAREDR